MSGNINQQRLFVSRADIKGEDHPILNGPDPEELKRKLAELAAMKEEKTNCLICSRCGAVVDQDIEPKLSRKRHNQNLVDSGYVLCLECMINNADNGGVEVSVRTSHHLSPPPAPTRAMLECIPPFPRPVNSLHSGSNTASSSVPSLQSTPDHEKGGVALSITKLKINFPQRKVGVFRRYGFDYRAYEAMQAQAQTEYEFDPVRSPKPVSVDDPEGKEAEEEGNEEFEECEYEYTDNSHCLGPAVSRVTRWIQSLAQSNDGAEASH